MTINPETYFYETNMKSKSQLKRENIQSGRPMNEKFYLVFARKTNHGVYCDFVPCTDKLQAQMIAQDLIDKKFIERYVIIKGELIENQG